MKMRKEKKLRGVMNRATKIMEANKKAPKFAITHLRSFLSLPINLSPIHMKVPGSSRSNIKNVARLRKYCTLVSPFYKLCVLG